MHVQRGAMQLQRGSMHCMHAITHDLLTQASGWILQHFLHVSTIVGRGTIAAHNWGLIKGRPSWSALPPGGIGKVL